VCVLSLRQHAQERTNSSLPSPPPSCVWKLPETNGPYCDLMRPFACVYFPCEFIPRLRHVNAQGEPHGLPASSRKLRLMWHEKLSRTQIDHDRGRERATTNQHLGYPSHGPASRKGVVDTLGESKPRSEFPKARGPIRFG